MKITAIHAYSVKLPLKEGRYAWSGGNFVDVFDATVVQLETDAGITGFGECCPLGPAYLPAYAEGVRAGIREIGPKLLGLDPRQTGVLNAAMDAALRGHPYVKSAIDMACWDILGKAANLPAYMLLGGAEHGAVPLYRAISQDTPENMAKSVAGYRAEGYTKFQLKVGGKPDDDIERIIACRAVLTGGELLVADANTGWTIHAAARVVNAVRDIDVTIEQPCKTYEESLAIRRRTALPFVLDEVITDFSALLRALQDGAMDGVNLKISKLGGITRMQEVRSLCVACGIAMTIEDSWGGDIITAAILHLAASTPPALLLSTTDFNSYGTVSFTSTPPLRVGGMLEISQAPGLGTGVLLPSVGGKSVSIT